MPKPSLATWPVGGRSGFRFYFFTLPFLNIFLLPCPNLMFTVLPSQALFFCSQCQLELKATYKVTSHQTSAG